VDSRVWRSYDATGSWAVGSDDVARLEAGFPAAVRKALPDLARPLSTYFRQYAGIVRDGRRWIVVLGIRESALGNFEGEEEKRFLQISDGGDDYIDAEYDAESGTFAWISIHGEA
jgi:hypothetical protein